LNLDAVLRAAEQVAAAEDLFEEAEEDLDEPPIIPSKSDL